MGRDGTLADMTAGVVLFWGITVALVAAVAVGPERIYRTAYAPFYRDADAQEPSGLGYGVIRSGLLAAAVVMAVVSVVVTRQVAGGDDGPAGYTQSDLSGIAGSAARQLATRTGIDARLPTISDVEGLLAEHGDPARFSVAQRTAARQVTGHDAAFTVRAEESDLAVCLWVDTVDAGRRLQAGVDDGRC